MIKKNIKILIIGGDLRDYNLIKILLAYEAYSTYEIKHTEKSSPGLETIKNDHFDIILIYLMSLKSDELNLLEKIQEISPGIPVIAVIESRYEYIISEVFNIGVQDYLLRGKINREVIIRSIDYSIERQKLLNQINNMTNQYHNIFNNINDNIIVYSIEQDGLTQKITEATESTCKMLEYSKDEILNTLPSEILPKEFLENQKIKSDNFNPFENQVFNLTIKSKSGTAIPVQVKNIKIQQNKNEYAYLIINYREEIYNTSKEIINIQKMKNIMSGIIKAMSMTVEAKDPYTAGHQNRVSKISSEIASEMHLSEDQIEGIKMASTIHDLGKIYVPSEILSKPGTISEAELNLIKLHPGVGYDILKRIEFPWPIADIIHQHHERINGSGYPSGLKDNEILLEAKIIAVADVVEAMISHRPYRAALGVDKALIEIKNKRGILYDSDTVEICCDIFQKNNFTLSKDIT